MSKPLHDGQAEPEPPSAPGRRLALAERLGRRAAGGRERAASAGSRSRRARPLLLVLGVGLVVLALVFVARRIGDDAPGGELDLEGRVAVLPVGNLTGDRGHAWVTLGLMEMISETLASGQGVEVIPPARLRRAISRRGLDRDDPAARERLRELARDLGAGVVVDAAVRRDAAGAYRLGYVFYGAEGAANETARGEIADQDLLAAAARLGAIVARGLAAEYEPPRLERMYARDPFLDRLYAMGVHELRDGRPAAARPYFEIALRHQPRFPRARARLAEALRELGDLEESRELTLAVLQEAQGRGDRRLQAEALARLGRLAALAGQLDAAEQHDAQAFSILLSVDDRSARAELVAELARLALGRGDEARAEERLVELLELRQGLGDRLGQVDTLLEIGSLYLARDDPEAAGPVFTQAHGLARELGDPWLEMRVTASLGEVAWRRGDAEAAERLWTEALAFAEKRQDSSRKMVLARNLAEVMLRSKRFREAEDLLHEVKDLGRQLESPAFEADASLRLAWVLLRTGYPLQARTHLDRALELDQWIVEERPLLERVIAWFAYEQGNYRLAVDTLERVKSQARGQGWSGWDQGFLDVYRHALATGRRWPVPGEEGYLPLEKD